jgi:HEAT repeat protein
LAFKEHPSEYVRGSVLRFIARVHPDKALPIFLEKLKDPHYIVRENAADELGDLGLPSVISDLRPLLLDPHPNVRQATETAIDMLSDI